MGKKLKVKYKDSDKYFLVFNRYAMNMTTRIDIWCELGPYNTITTNIEGLKQNEIMVRLDNIEYLEILKLLRDYNIIKETDEKYCSSPFVEKFGRILELTDEALNYGDE